MVFRCVTVHLVCEACGVARDMKEEFGNAGFATRSNGGGRELLLVCSRLADGQISKLAKERIAGLALGHG